MGTPEFAVPALEALQQATEVVAVYTQPDRPAGRGQRNRESAVKQKALSLELPVFQPERLSAPGEYERLAEMKPDCIVVVAYGQLLKKNVLELPPFGCVNIHASLLPRWRGAAPIHWSLLAGDSETGVTTMKMVERLDAGDILLVKKTPIQPTDTVVDLHDRLAGMGGELIVQTLNGLKDGTLVPQPQNESLATYASKLTKGMEILNCALPVEELDRRIRALNPWPGTSIEVVGLGRIKIIAARPKAGIQVAEGQIEDRQGRLLMGVRGGALELLRLQADGKRAMSGDEFFHGLKNRKIAFPLAVTPQK